MSAYSTFCFSKKLFTFLLHSPYYLRKINCFILMGSTPKQGRMPISSSSPPFFLLFLLLLFPDNPPCHGLNSKETWLLSENGLPWVFLNGWLKERRRGWQNKVWMRGKLGQLGDAIRLRKLKSIFFGVQVFPYSTLLLKNHMSSKMDKGLPLEGI